MYSVSYMFITWNIVCTFLEYHINTMLYKYANHLAPKPSINKTALFRASLYHIISIYYNNNKQDCKQTNKPQATCYIISVIRKKKKTLSHHTQTSFHLRFGLKSERNLHIKVLKARTANRPWIKTLNPSIRDPSTQPWYSGPTKSLILLLLLQKTNMFTCKNQKKSHKILFGTEILARTT